MPSSEHQSQGRLLRLIRKSVDRFARSRSTAKSHKAIEALIQTATPYRLLLETIREGAALLAPDLTLLSCNPRFAEMLSKSPDRIVGQPLLQFVPSEDRPHLEMLLNSELDGVRRIQVKLSVENAPPLPAELIVRQLRLEKTRVVCIVAADLSEDRRFTAENNLQSLLRLSRQLEQAQTNTQVLSAALAEVKLLLGYQNLWVYLFSEDRKHAKAIVARGQTSEPAVQEFATLTIQGDAMLEEIAAATEIVVIEDARTDLRTNKEIVARLGNRTIVNVPVMLYDRHLGSVGTGTFSEEGVRIPTKSQKDYLSAMASHMAVALDRIRLLDECQQAEEEVRKLNQDLERRAAELEIANQELEAFSYSISHDLRTPLATIGNLARMFLEEYAAQVHPRGQRVIQLIRDDTRAMEELIQGLLAFARVSRQPLQKQWVAQGDLVRAVWAELLAVQTERRVELTMGELPACEADPVLLKQVWRNLLSNALKFTVKREIAQIEFGFRQVGEENVFFVKDNGAGFDLEQAGKLFGVFQRLHPEEEYEGSGVGLAIVERIIRRHGGRIWAQAAVDRGATFYFTLSASTRIPHGP